MSVYEHHHVGPANGVPEETVTRTRWAFGPGQVIGGVVGIAEVVVAVLAITRCGIDGALNTPVTSVAGMTQSTAVGIAELILGLLLVSGAASAWNRGVMGAAGALMFVGGLVVAAASPKLLLDLGTDHHTGWVVLVGGVVAMVAAALPVFVHSSQRYDVG